MRRHRREGRQSFLRDVLANVIANLVTAAIVYLAAVAGGYIEANPQVASVAMALLAAAITGAAAYSFALPPGKLPRWLRPGDRRPPGS